MIKVFEYMTPLVAVVSPHDTLATVRNVMLRKRVGRVPVLDDGGRVSWYNQPNRSSLSA